MLIEDNPTLLKRSGSWRMMDCLIQFLQFECTKFMDPIKAVEEYSKQEFDLVITDYQMPGLNGIEVINKILVINPAADVIIMSGTEDIEVRAKETGAAHVFNKPPDFNRLINTVKSYAKKRKNKRTVVPEDVFALSYQI